MGRPKNKSKFKIIDWVGRSFWYVEYFSEKAGKDIRKSTGYRKADYSREQVQTIIDAETGTKKVAEHSVDWLEQHTLYCLEIEGRSDMTKKMYEYAFRYLREVYGREYDVTRIDRSAIRKLQGKMHEAGKSNACINTYLRQLNASFNRLVFDGMIPVSPFFCFQRNNKLEEHERRAMSNEELQRLDDALDSEKDDRLRRLIHVLLLTGRRLSEVLSFADIDFIKRRYTYTDAKKRRKPQIRAIFPPEILNDLTFFVENAPDSPYPLRIWTRNTLGSKIKSVLRSARIPEEICAHCFRHTAITRALERGQSIRDVQKVVGHSSVTVTERYAHDVVEDVLDVGLK